ncbi:MAG: IS1 family transposase [Acidobacteriota bacterium]
MVCHHCHAGSCNRFGKTSDGRQKFRCRTCRRILTEAKDRPAIEIRIPRERALLILSLLCEGASVRAIERITRTEKRTILRLLSLVGPGCERLLDGLVTGVEAGDVEADEIWTYISAKAATVKRKKIQTPDAGDAYCFIGLSRETKLVLAWHLGKRTSEDADTFMGKLAGATTGRFHLSTDGFSGYAEAVEKNFGARVDYGQVVKEFGSVGGQEARRYAPPRLIGQEKFWISGTPDYDRIGTSRIERANWTLRTHMRRFTRLSNGFSRKKANLRAALALFFAYYNLVKIHRSVRMTPAMNAGLTRNLWSMGDLLDAAVAA